MEATPLERDIFQWIAERNPTLSELLRKAHVVRRQRAAAFFSYLMEDAAEFDTPPINGPNIQAPEAGVSGGSLLWLVKGQPACLEVYTLGERFTEELQNYELLACASTV